MTTLEALKSFVKYPVDDTMLSIILRKRGLLESEEPTTEILSSTAFAGARADCYKELVDAPNLNEGGIGISLRDGKLLISLANDIYAKIGEPLIHVDNKPPTIIATYE